MSEGGVFWWRSECEGVLSAVWDDLVLLLHTMEEKQVQPHPHPQGVHGGQKVTSLYQQIHIVKPVKSRLKNIIQSTTTFIDGQTL